jgi:hypothetical protein
MSLIICFYFVVPLFFEYALHFVAGRYFPNLVQKYNTKKRLSIFGSDFFVFLTLFCPCCNAGEPSE